MDDDQDDDREREESAAVETSAEPEDRAMTEDRETPEPPAPEAPAYTPDEYQLAAKIKAKRLYKEENGRIPYSDAEVFHFLLKAKIESPLTPDDEDLEAARRKLEATGS